MVLQRKRSQESLHLARLRSQPYDNKKYRINSAGFFFTQYVDLYIVHIMLRLCIVSAAIINFLSYFMIFEQ